MNIIITVNSGGILGTGLGESVVNNNINAAITEATLFLNAQVKSRTPRRTGNLSRSIQHEISGKGTPLVKGVVGTSQLYALAVETGTGVYGPKKVPFVIKAKPGKWLFWPGAGHPVKQVTIQGMVGAHMFENAFKESLPMLDRIFAKYGLKIAAEVNK